MEKNIKNSKECDICGNNATSLCFECINYFCDACYKFIHDKQRNSFHKKEKIDPYVPIELKCPEHPKDRINLFCTDEKGIFIIFINLNKIYRIFVFTLLL